MDLKQLRYFLYVAKIEHMSQAAALLNISQPTLSKSISALESDLGVILFDRVGNRIRLNENGMRFREYAQKLIDLFDTAVLSVRQTQYEVSGNITIGCWAYASILLPCINEYTILNPYININITQYTHTAQSSSAEASYDFILTSSNINATAPQNDQFWVSEPLFTEKGLLVIAPKHPMYKCFCEYSGELEFDMFKDLKFIGMRKNNLMLSGIDNIPNKNFQFFPKTYFQTDDFVVRIHALESGLGVALIPESCLEDAERLCPGLKHFQIKNYTSHRTILLMRKKKNLLSEAALDFWDFVLDYYNLPYDKRQ